MNTNRPPKPTHIDPPHVWHTKTRRWIPRVSSRQGDLLLDLLRQHDAYRNGEALHPGPKYNHHGSSINALRDRGWIERQAVNGFRVYALTRRGAEQIKEWRPQFITSRLNIDDIAPLAQKEQSK